MKYPKSKLKEHFEDGFKSIILTDLYRELDTSIEKGINHKSIDDRKQLYGSIYGYCNTDTEPTLSFYELLKKDFFSGRKRVILMILAFMSLGLRFDANDEHYCMEFLIILDSIVALNFMRAIMKYFSKKILAPVLSGFFT